MLRDEDIRIERGRASHGGDFIRLTHMPTGILNEHPGPLKGANQQRLISAWLSEIEAELQAKGFAQFIIPDHRTRQGKRKWRPA